VRVPSVELVGLVVGVFLGLVHLVIASHAASLTRGYRWAAGPRDEILPPLAGLAGRLARASANYLETFPYFGCLVVAVFFAGRHGALSTWGVCLYIVGRVMYLPLYACGTYLLRSLAWNVATAGIVLLCLALVWRPNG
jgi:uncharacterized MAPEG superfamily protein